MEHYGIKVCLVHPREVQQVKGRKSDVKDSQWIQRMYSAGLLRESILSGERDPQKLVLLCHEKILKEKRADVIKSLEGNYNEGYLMLLKENLRLWQEQKNE